MDVDKLAEIVGAIFLIDPAEVNDDTSPQTVKRWDSLGHLELFVALEGAFGVRFKPEEVMSSLSVGAIRSLLAARQGSGSRATGAADGTAAERASIQRRRSAGQKHEVAIVTGASRGIGAVIARELARDGFKVVINYLSSRERAEALAGAIKAEGGQAIACQADVRDQGQAARLVEAARDTFGGVGVLVNNAAGSIRTVAFSALRWEDFQADLDTHLKGTFHCCREVVELMMEAGYGKIINIGSAFVAGAPPRQLAHYVAAKSALVGLSKSLAVELAPSGISVNVVLPSITLTDQTSHLPTRFLELEASQTPMQRLAEPEDVAATVLMLARESSNFLTGAVIPVAGGRVMM